MQNVTLQSVQKKSRKDEILVSSQSRFTKPRNDFRCLCKTDIQRVASSHQEPTKEGVGRPVQPKKMRRHLGGRGKWARRHGVILSSASLRNALLYVQLTLEQQFELSVEEFCLLRGDLRADSAVPHRVHEAHARQRHLVVAASGAETVSAAPTVVLKQDGAAELPTSCRSDVWSENFNVASTSDPLTQKDSS